MKDEVLHLCVQQLLAWYRDHYRPLPWRRNPSPYHVWVSEIMLQQTRIEAALPFYERFIREVPDIPALAALSEDKLLKLWEGLGYYSRARNLQKAARIVCDQYGGDLPSDYQALLSLPGIGEYAAGAIASIAFSIAVPAVDGNVMRVLSRLCADETDVLSSVAKRHYTAIASRMVPDSDPGAFNQAVMELGETICLPNTAPRCDACPLSTHCRAYAEGKTLQLPVRIKRSSRRTEQRVVALVIDRTSHPPRVLIHKRTNAGLLAGMWEFPNAPEGEKLLPDGLTVTEMVADLPQAKHQFSHIVWHMRAALYSASLDELPSDYAAATAMDLQGLYALPSAFRVYSALIEKFLCKEDGSCE